jgi:hypothetical protein
MIETTTFRLAPHADVDEFLAADRAVQTEAIATHPGFLRRTTARGEDGYWLIVTLWRAAADAEASRLRSADHPAVRALIALRDESTLSSRRYATLD